MLGAGAIGIEEAYLLSRQGLHVTLIEMLDRVMPRTLDPDMSAELQSYIEAKGVELCLEQKVTAVEGADRVVGVQLESGEQIQAGMVIVSAGARCHTELAERAGLELGALGLKVNEHLQTSDPDIYAGGDVVEYPSHITGKPSLGQLRPNAVIAGRVMARNLLGEGVVYPALVNSFCTKFFDKSIAAAGLTESGAAEDALAKLAAA
jgi:NADPH-dependent 2,4-dienoyl-CoA reductase/sulfur reductase-like enzyme